MITKGDGLEIHDFYNGQNIHFLSIRTIQDMDNCCTKLYNCEVISSFFKKKKIVQVQSYCFMYAFE